MVRQFVGSNYSDDGSDKDVPVNLLALYVGIVGKSLIAKNPRVHLSTFNRSHKPTVRAMQDWCNQEIERLQLASTLQRVVLDALFSVGIAKVALATPQESALVAWNVRAGAPYCESVDLDDFVYDTHACDLSHAAFVGHRVRVPLEVAKDTYKVKKLRADEDEAYNEGGDERIGVIGKGTASDEEEFEEMVDLWEIYLPRHREVYCIADQHLDMGDNESVKPLSVRPWLGPDTGPYHFLGFGVVPGNAMPKAPLQDLLTLHLTVNHLYRKLIRQAERQKSNTAVAGGADEDGNRIMHADDGDIIRVDRPDQIVQMETGGPNNQNYVLAESLRNLFSYLGGNLDMLGGLSPQSKTATQDKLLAEGASRSMQDMQERTVEFTSQVIRAMCWYWKHDPFRVMRTKYAVPGTPEIEAMRTVGPRDREPVSFEEMEVRIDPYSLRHKSPEERMAMIDQMVTQVLVPMAPILQQQGVVFDAEKWLEIKEQYMDEPGLRDLLSTADPPTVESSTGADAAPKPGQTERKYVRENRPGRTEQGDMMHLRNSLMGVETGGNPMQNGAMKNGVPK